MTDVDPEIFSPQALARFDSLAEAVTNLLNDAQEPPDVILNLLTTVLGEALGQISPAHKIDSSVEMIAEQVTAIARKCQEHPDDRWNER